MDLKNYLEGRLEYYGRMSDQNPTRKYNDGKTLTDEQMSGFYHGVSSWLHIILDKVKEQSSLNEDTQLDIKAFIDYEIRSSWWASWIGWNWGQELSGKYFAWKVKRKYERYKQSKIWEQRTKNLSKPNR